MQRLVNEANQYAQHFGLKTRFSCPTTETMLAECRKIEEQNKAREAQRAQQEQQRREKWVAQQKQVIQDWVDGKRDDCPSGYGSDVYGPIRLRIKGDELQTSMGATVPLDHAVKCFRILKQLRAKGETYVRNGHTVHLGHFALDAFDGQTVRAGCHSVEWTEIERIANLVGVN